MKRIFAFIGSPLKSSVSNTAMLTRMLLYSLTADTPGMCAERVHDLLGMLMASMGAIGKNMAC